MKGFKWRKLNEEKSNAKCRLHYAMSVDDIYKWIDRSTIDFKHLWLRSEWTGIVNNAVFELYFIG